MTPFTNRDSDGTLLYQTDMTYDSLKRPFTQTDSRTGPSTRYYLNTATDVVNRTLDHLSRETLFTYDHRGRAKTTDLPDTLNESGGTIANVSTTFYFPDGTVREQSGDGGYRTTQTYDYAGRVATLTTYGTETAVTRWIYDSDRGLLTGKLYNSPTPGSGQGPSYTYTPAGRLKTRTQTRLVSGNPLVTTYTYGTASGGTPASLDQVTHSDGTPAFTVATRDRLGRPMEVLDPAAGNHSLKYTRHGALEEDSITSGILAGQKLVQGFDSRLRPGSHTTSFGAQALGETAYQYGPSGAVRSVSGNGNTASYFYHPQQRTLENVTYTKDGEAGPMLQSTRKHDAANRLTRITAHVNDAGVQKPIDHHAYDYDALDHIQKHTGITGAFWKYGYNATGEVTGATRKMPDATTDYFGRNYRYHYDGIGNRTSVEQSRNGAQASRLFSYTPNALNQYSAITHPDFVDVSGTANPLAAVTVNGIAAARQSDYFYKELSENNSAGPQWVEATVTDGTTTTNGSLSLPAIATSPIHDGDGNLKSDGEWIYTWDAENRLIGLERSAAALAAGAPYHREKHDYDHRSRRIRTTIFTNSGTTPSSQTLYIFDGWKCVAELDASGQPIRKYTWGLDLANHLDDVDTGNVGALLWLVDSATAKTHIHLYDKNGNVTGLVDAITRKRSAIYEYDAFGQLITCYGDYAKSNPFTFSTKFTDYATGLRYYGYRWYGAKDGRWLSRDPIEERGGISLYGFVGNDGLNRWDVLGLEEKLKKMFFVGKDQNSVVQILPPIDPKYQDPSDPNRGKPRIIEDSDAEAYKLMISAAKQAEFEVVENATMDMATNAWKLKACSHIVFYMHGTPSGDLQETLRGKTAPVTAIFDPKVGAAQTLDVACCHYDKAVKKFIPAYNAAGVSLRAVEAPMITNDPAHNDGEVYRSDYRRALTAFFAKISSTLENH